MKFTYIIAAAAVVLTVAAAPKAEAAYYDGVATTNLNVRAGPGKYPLIGKIARGTPIPSAKIPACRRAASTASMQP